MADQAITALPKKTYSGSSQIASTDYLLGIDSAEGYQMLIQDLGEYIINRATASLAGSTQTLASAISALNSKLTLTGEYNYAESFSSAETLGSKLDALLNAQSSYVIGCYRLSCTASFGVFQNGYDYYVQMARASSLNFVMAEFTPIDNALIKILGKRRVEGWSFELAPSRTEINTLNSKTTVEAINITAESGITNNLFVRKQSGIVTINGYIASSSAFGTNQTVATIPAGARPIAPVRSTCALVNLAYNSPGSMGYVSVDSSDGTIVVTAPSNNTYKTAYFSLSYMAQS